MGEKQAIDIGEELLDEDDLSVSMTSSYDSINQSGNFNNSYQLSKSKSFYSVADEQTPLNGRRNVRKNTTTSSRHYISYTASLANTTHSFSKLTTSNYFGFSSSAYATAHRKEVEVSKTMSLLDVISLDRFTPTIVSFFTILSMITGLSIFVLPSLVAHCGLSIIPLIVCVGVILWYTSYLVNLCQYQTTKLGIKKRVYRNFIDLGRASIKWHGEGLMKILVATSVFTDIYSLIFCAQISTDVLSKYIDLDNRIWMLIWVALVFPLFFIRKMSILAWFGFIALLLYVVGLSFAFALLIWHHNVWSWHNVNSEFNLQYFFVGYGVIINTFNLHLAVPALEGSMKHGEKFNKINSIAFIINTTIKLFLAVVGAAAFGVLTQGSLLTNLIVFGVYATVVSIMIGLYMYTSYPTSMFVVFEMMDIYILPKFKLFQKGEKSEYAWLILSRLVVSVFIAFVAVSLPNFEMVTGLVGNVRGTLTTIILPIYFYLQIHKRKISIWSKIFHWLLIVIATCFAITGAGYSIYGML